MIISNQIGTQKYKQKQAKDVRCPENQTAVNREGSVEHRPEVREAEEVAVRMQGDGCPKAACAGVDVRRVDTVDLRVEDLEKGEDDFNLELVSVELGCFPPERMSVRECKEERQCYQTTSWVLVKLSRVAIEAENDASVKEFFEERGEE